MSPWEELKKEQDEVMEKESEVSTDGIEFIPIKDSKLKRGIKILSYGNFSTGKTHFALTSEKPVYVIDTENGASPLADKFPETKILKICEQAGDDTDEKDDVKNFEKYQQAVKYLVSLPDEQVGTIVIDTITDVWDWCQAYAKTKIFKIPIEKRFNQQWDWSVPNKLFFKQLIKLINKDANVILVARAGEEYAGPGQPTGTFKPQTQKKTPYYVDVVLFHRIHIIKGEPVFSVVIEKCRQKGSIVGKVVDNPSFDKIKELLATK